MSTPFPLEEQSQTERFEPLSDPWKGPPQPHWYSGMGFTEDTAYLGPFYRTLEAAGSGAAKGEAVMSGLRQAWYGSQAAVLEALHVPSGYPRFKQQEALADEQDARDRVKAMTPDAATTGIATNLLHSVGESAYLVSTGGLLGGPAAAAALVGTTEGGSRYQELREQGVDRRTAVGSGMLSGIASAAGAIMPAAYGSTLATRLLTGAGSNTAFGAGNRYLDHRLLEISGYPEMAEQQKAWDGTSMLVDAALGATFGGIHHAFTPAEKRAVTALQSPDTRDAALAANLSIRDRAAAPGVPVDPAAAGAHQAALEKATSDLLQGKPVDVSEAGLDDSAFLARPAQDTSPALELFAKSLKESGFLHEEASAQDLEEQLAQRQSGERPVQTPAKAAAPNAAAPDRGAGAAFLNEFQEGHPQNPKEPTEHLVNGDVRVEMASDPFDANTVHVNSIQAERPGSGSGTAAMQELTALADKHNVRVTLDAQPLGKEGITGEKLVAWYKRFGFEVMGTSGPRTVMERLPNKAAESVTSEAARPGGEYTVGEQELTDEQRQAFERRSNPPGEVLPAAVEGGGQAGQGRPQDDGGRGTVGGAGGPTRVYRGGAELRPEHFEPESLGKASGHPSSGLGVFFTNDAGDAARYGPVGQHDLTLQNPKRIPVEDLPGFDTPAEATAFREKLRAQGHDGIVIDSSHLGGPKHYVVFDPRQAIPADAAQSAPIETQSGARVPKGAPDSSRDSALEFLAKKGGIDIAAAKSEGFDPADMKAQRTGIRHAFHRKGMSIESAGEALAQAGYPVTDATGAVDKNKTIDLMARELAGRKQYSVNRAPAEFERELAQHTADQAAARAQLHEDMAENPEWAEQSPDTRSFTELANEARRHATPEEVDAALEANDDMEARRRLDALIARGEPAHENRGVAEGTRPGATEPVVARQPPREQDLFGQDTRAAQGLADETRRRDLARNSGQESLETGRPDDLFSQASHQVDITDALAERPNLQIPDENGQPVKAADALAQTDAAAKQDENDWFTATKAATDCFSRRGG